MKYFKEYWYLGLVGIIWLPIIIFAFILQHNESKLEYRPGETYNFTMSNVNFDLWGDNITVTYHYDDIRFVKKDKYYFQK